MKFARPGVAGAGESQHREENEDMRIYTVTYRSNGKPEFFSRGHEFLQSEIFLVVVLASTWPPRRLSLVTDVRQSYTPICCTSYGIWPGSEHNEAYI